MNLILLQAPSALAQGSYAAAGRQKFNERKYDEAVDLFRKHLRRAPSDYSTWNQLGAAYFHTGQPRKALRYLKQVERLTSDKSYNYYYQGLCFLASEQPDKAQEYFQFIALKFTDEYGSRATFEMASIEYNLENASRAYYWAQLYLQRYPNGVYRSAAMNIMQLASQGDFSKKFDGVEKPDIERALFKYNKLSLSPKPHYWLLDIGSQYIDIAGQEPDPKGGIKPRNSNSMAAIVNASIGAGPLRQGDMTVFGGYNYRQKWNTDTDRISTYGEDFTDISYFPLRGDLLERRHQFYGDFRRDIGKGFFYGIFGRYELARIGSTVFPGPDDAELRKVLSISDTSLFIPWIGAAYNGNMRTLLYLYMRKEINSDSPEHSNKTYDLGISSSSGGGQPILSFGISHDIELPKSKTNLNIEMFRYEFIYNDYWLDYKRNGFFASADHELLPRWFIYGLFGYYRDEYILPRLKLKPCGTQPNPTTAGGQTPGNNIPSRANECSRNDTGTLIQAGVWWNWTQFQRFSADLQMVENKNPAQQEFEESRLLIQFQYTMAFPSVKRVTRFVNRYADTAFTKEAE